MPRSASISPGTRTSPATSGSEEVFDVTTGVHRSVYLVERLAEHFRTLRGGVISFHRELE